MHPLDRPVWGTLTTAHAHLAVGGPLAWRFEPRVNLFASARDDGGDCLAALTALITTHGRSFIMQVPDIVIPATLHIAKHTRGVQMIVAGPLPEPDDTDTIVTMTESDVPEMVALATLTEPGPFLPRTHTMGRFLGIRIGGRLAAMAGERFRLPGYTELSGVCTHPDFRALGLARRLSIAVAANIQASGESPFLHAWKTNQAAIALYESIGFRIRAEVDVAVLDPP